MNQIESRFLWLSLLSGLSLKFYPNWSISFSFVKSGSYCSDPKYGVSNNSTFYPLMSLLNAALNGLM